MVRGETLLPEVARLCGDWSAGVQITTSWDRLHVLPALTVPKPQWVHPFLLQLTVFQWLSRV